MTLTYLDYSPWDNIENFCLLKKLPAKFETYYSLRKSDRTEIY